MDARLTLSVLVIAALGCNGLTGVNDLEPVDCVDCVDAAAVDSSPSRDSAAAVDTGRDTTTNVDTAPLDTGCTSDLGCDDGNACTADACDVMTGACTHQPIDADGDGESPSALGPCGTDCNDNNPSVSTKQTAFFTTAYTTPGGLRSFDYNCDGVEEKQYPRLTVCDTSSGSCVETSGWASTVPACGQLAKRAICIKAFGCARGTAENATAQPCR